MSRKERTRDLGKIFLPLLLAGIVTGCGGGGSAEGAEATGEERVEAIHEAMGTTSGTERSPATQGRGAAGGGAPARVTETRTIPVRTIPAGTTLTFEVTETLSTSSHSSGDRFGLRLVSDASGTHGARLPQGTEGRGVVTESRRSRSSDQEAVLALAVEAVQLNGSRQELIGAVESLNVHADAGDSGTRSALKVATGTAAGAMVGRILGGDSRGAVRGAAVGTVAGVGIALSTRDGHATLPAGSLVVVRLAEPLMMP